MKPLLLILLLVGNAHAGNFYLELGVGSGDLHLELGRTFKCFGSECHCQWSHESDPGRGNFLNDKEDDPKDFWGCGARWQFD